MASHFQSIQNDFKLAERGCLPSKKGDCHINWLRTGVPINIELSSWTKQMSEEVDVRVADEVRYCCFLQLMDVPRQSPNLPLDTPHCLPLGLTPQQLHFLPILHPMDILDHSIDGFYFLVSLWSAILNSCPSRPRFFRTPSIIWVEGEVSGITGSLTIIRGVISSSSSSSSKSIAGEVASMTCNGRQLSQLSAKDT